MFDQHKQISSLLLCMCLSLNWSCVESEVQVEDAMVPSMPMPNINIEPLPDASQFNDPPNLDQGMPTVDQAAVLPPQMELDVSPSPVDQGMLDMAMEPEVTEDECSDVGSACDVCTCRLCQEELTACLTDPECASVLDCAQRTGCGGIDCLSLCGDEIDAAGGPFGDSVTSAQAVGECREGQCGTNEAECSEADPGPPNPGPPPPPEMPDDDCQDAGDACDVCTCQNCQAEIALCAADPDCQAIVDCARRTGCQGINCLTLCEEEVDAAGGALSAAVSQSQAIDDCRVDRCGQDLMECEQSSSTPNVGGCMRFEYEELCSTGQTPQGEAYCEMYVRTRGTCREWCQEAGAVCLDAWDERGDRCEYAENHGCDDRETDQICRCTE